MEFELIEDSPRLDARKGGRFHVHVLIYLGIDFESNFVTLNWRLHPAR
jgi:hypothetical protein